MKRKTLFISDQQGCDQFNADLLNGWVIDPLLYDGKPFHLDSALIVPLVFYESEDEKPKPEPEKPLGATAEGCMLVNAEDVSARLQEGWLIYATPTSSSKQVWMIKPKEKSP